MIKIRINSEYITLAQFLKLSELVFSGGEAKIFLTENKILVNDEPDQRRGRKLYPGDIITVLNKKYQIC